MKQLPASVQKVVSRMKQLPAGVQKVVSRMKQLAADVQKVVTRVKWRSAIMQEVVSLVKRGLELTIGQRLKTITTAVGFPLLHLLNSLVK